MPDHAVIEEDKVRAQSVEIVVKNNGDPSYKKCDKCLGPFRTPIQHSDHADAWLSEISMFLPDDGEGKAVDVVNDAGVSAGKGKGKVRIGVDDEAGVSAGITDKGALASPSPSPSPSPSSTAAEQQTKSWGSSSSKQEESINPSLMSQVASISLVDPGSEKGPVGGDTYPGVTVTFSHHLPGGHGPNAELAPAGPSNKCKRKAEDSDGEPAKPTRTSPPHSHVDPGEAHWRNYEARVFKDSPAQAGLCSGAGNCIIRRLMALPELDENLAIGRDRQPVNVPEEGQIAITERAAPNANSCQLVQVPGFSIDITGTDASVVPWPEEHRMAKVRFGGPNVPRGW